MAPINLPDGTEVSEIVLPDGSTASKVLAPDGSTVFSAIPDKAVHQYDATELSGTDGDAIGTVSDQIGSDDLTQSTSSQQPTLRTGSNGINGNNIIEFDDSDDLMNVVFSNISEPYEYFIVFRMRSNTDFDVILDGASNKVEFYDSSTSTWRIRQGTNVEGTSSDTNNHIGNIIWRDGSNNDILNIDGSQNASGDSGNSTLDGLTVGADRAGSNNAPVDIGEIVTYNDELTSSERSNEESRLSDKWGITI